MQFVSSFLSYMDIHVSPVYVTVT